MRGGALFPLGVYEVEGGINFAFFSRGATQVRLELFGDPLDATRIRVINLDAPLHRTGDIWHAWVGGFGAGQLYAYRVEGPYDSTRVVEDGDL